MAGHNQVTQFEISPDFIDLGLGDPPFSLLPMDLLNKAAVTRLVHSNQEILQYGKVQGADDFRLALAGFLTRQYGCPVDPEHLLVTNGSSMGLHLACSFFSRPGDTIFVEEPTYHLALRIFADHELVPVPIPVDEDGMIVDALAEKLVENHPQLLYIVPTYQNPSGRTLSPERRQKLVELSREHGFLVIADEVYQLLGYTNNPPLPLAAEIANAPIISLSSFSKILAPGLKIGWMQASKILVNRIAESGLLDSGGGMNPFTSGIVCQIIEDGSLQTHVSTLSSYYRGRCMAMDSALKRHMPYASALTPQGGFFFWVRLPEGVDSSEVEPYAAANKVGFRPGTLFSSSGGLQNFLRLCFAFYEPYYIEQGILRLKETLESPRVE